MLKKKVKKQLYLRICTQCMKKFMGSVQQVYCSNYCNPNSKEFNLKKCRPHCSICNKPYEIKRLYQSTCSEECDIKLNNKFEKFDDELNNVTCIKCNKPFRRAKRESLCENCRQTNKINNKLDQRKDEIEKWVNAKKRKGVSLQELIRRSEWKRVFDEEGWNHYLKGRRWDRI